MKKQVVAAADIGELDTVAASDKGARIELKHPTTGAPTGVFLIMLGKHSSIFQEIVRERANKRIRENANATRRGKQPEIKTAEMQEAEGIEMLAACTIGWESETRTKVEGKEDEVVVSPTLKFRGEDLPFNVANALRVYRELLWVREQADAAIGDLENFITA